MVSTRRKKAAVSTEFIDDSDESDGNQTYQEEGSSDEEDEDNDNDEEEEEAVMSEPEIVEVPSTPRKRGRPPKIPATPTPSKGKKRTINEVAGSDSEASFIASPIHDSPKKPRVAPSTTKNPPATPSKKTPAKAKVANKTKTPTKAKTTPAVSNKATSPSKVASTKKSKVAASNNDNEQESVVSDDDPSESGHDSPTPTGKKNKAHQVIFDTSVLKTKASIEKSKKKKTAQDVFDKDEVMSDGDKTDDGEKEIVYLEDIDRDPSPSYPKLSKCGVAASDLIDPLLKETYKKLTKLPGQVINKYNVSSYILLEPYKSSGLKFISWKDSNNDQEDDNGNGMILFSSIGDVHPNINLKYIKGLVVFEKDYTSNIVNLSRIDPSLLVSKKTSGQTKGGPLVFIRDRKTPALCVTLGIIVDDQTESPRQRGDKEVKFITAKLLAYEYERMVAVLCMTFKRGSVRVQLADSTLTFATRSAEPKSGSSPVKGFTTVRSKATMSNDTPNRKFRYSSSLGPHDLVPILDARTKHIKMPSGLGSIEKDLPPFGRQVPTGSIALIGYTVGSYNSKANPNDVSLSMNVLWVAVLAASENTLQVYHYLHSYLCSTLHFR
ncbi:uncharacterized protein LACBIDRAFT_303646 [Laccaria bicolor S238N-H82]|uniref:Predicted protein n=1 Tax=Laccaria bicolor (strain S238N-H82 / ATCC MYA-4686) TaxID=486041 RepID=B0E481_LACBS|nr:uncharacterized protein LACBIDRAFT_303646 [Laccaria bicolor S238N-H82]EDQ98351.1 predicted protein [Laccaria bicolor S238N-H82]|eukprot:XP_001890999.1 predicted protein [Laccaria bicolor S238N-H82]